jgi:hypothetical protein
VKAPFGVVSFGLAFVGLGHLFVGNWEHPTLCPHMHWKGQRLVNPRLHHSMYVCEKVEDDTRWHILGT